MAKKSKKTFELPYIGFDHFDESTHVLYGSKGEASAIFAIRNTVEQYSADGDKYLDYHANMLNIIKIIGEGHFIQKIDVLSNQVFEDNISEEFLQKKYDAHFSGRIYTDIQTFLIITKKSKTSKYIYNEKDDKEFKIKISKVFQLLKETKFKPSLLQENEINNLVRRTLMMDFSSNVVTMDNIYADNDHLKIGNKHVKCISLIDIDNIDLPNTVTPYVEKNNNEAIKGFPVDTMAFLYGIKGYDTIIYNQVIDIPTQVRTLQKLELKKKRHQGVPDPQNDFAVQDIDSLLYDVAKENQLVVNAHYNIVIKASDENIDKVSNSIENALFGQGIIISKNTYNQLELFRTILPGNSSELKEYDWFLTTSDASICFFFKEALPISEPSNFFLRFTDRQGVPLKIDPSDYPRQIGRINNRNKFVLGPSGSGKSFLMNAIVEQYMLYNYDVVIVDTGDSYSGTCSYYGGKYITYTEEKPITMNPFLLKREEYNLEKKEFLITLISLLWKGADGVVNQVEQDVLTDVVTSYYELYFNPKSQEWFEGLSIGELQKYLRDNGIDTIKLLENIKETLSNNTQITDNYYAILDVKSDATLQDIKKQYRLLSNIYHPDKSNEAEKFENTLKFIKVNEAYQTLSNHENRIKYDSLIKLNALSTEILSGNFSDNENSDLMKLYKKELIVKCLALLDEFSIDRLCFDTFYEYSLRRIPSIIEQEKIQFDMDTYRYVLKKFYKGGEFDMILNETADKTLFDERFIVFEIDNIKEHKLLFPIVTLIIMDTFIQKMRLRKSQRKALIIEEAWKAIASPMMAGYILYLYKTVRKFWGEAIVVTQELGDIIGNAVVKDSIINNSDSVILLDQTKFKDNFTDIANLLSLNKVEQRKIFTINNLDNKDNRAFFKEFYFKRGDSGEVYGNETSLFQYLTYTTEKPEKLAVETYTNFYGNYQNGLDHFVADMNSLDNGLPLFVEFVNMFGEPLTDQAIHVIHSLIIEHRQNTINWLKRYLYNNEITFKDFVNQKLAS